MKNFPSPMMRSRQSERGFTLVELLTVMAITGFVTVSLLSRFSASRSELEQSTNAVMAHIRNIQSRAVNGLQYQGTYRCGYGIVNGDSRYFSGYAGSNATTTTCSTEDRNYNAGPDVWLTPSFYIPSPKIEFKLASPGVYFPAIFFEPPDPRTYICDNSPASCQAAQSALTKSPTRILMGIIGKDCSDIQDCRAICIYTSGMIEVEKDLICP